MRDYQVAGLNWLISLHENGISGILADEMGLGKDAADDCVPGISPLHLRHHRTTSDRCAEVDTGQLESRVHEWIPDINVLVLQGAKEERHDLINERLIDEKFDVCITSL